MTTYEKHMALYREHSDKAQEHLHTAILAMRQNDDETRRAEYDKYLTESRLANKHFGIAQAVATKHHNRILAGLPSKPLYTV